MYTQGHSRILNVGAYLPEQRVSSTEVMEAFGAESRLGLDAMWLERVTGIAARRVAPAEMEPSDMAVYAARQALDGARCAATEIDAIIYAGMTRDNVEPSTAHNVQRKLGAKSAIALDVTNACLGFMSAVHLMDSLIATGQVRRGLIVTGEKGYRYACHGIEQLIKTPDRELLNHLTAGLTLGDAGGAMLLGPKLGPDSGIMEIGVTSDGTYSELCVIRDDASPLRTDMNPLFSETVRMGYQLYVAMMGQRLKWRSKEIDYYVPHQVSTKAIRAHARAAGIASERIPNVVTEMGNLISATIPVALTQLASQGKLQKGLKVYLSGTGSGISIAQAGVIWDAA